MARRSLRSYVFSPEAKTVSHALVRWPLPSTFLSGTAAAAAIAGINSFGNLGGLIGPNAVAWFRDHTGTFATGLYFLSCCALISAIVTLVAVRSPGSRGAPARVAAA